MPRGAPDVYKRQVQNRESVTADKVSEWVLKGTVDVEDERFYEHNGVDIIGIGPVSYTHLDVYKRQYSSSRYAGGHR